MIFFSRRKTIIESGILSGITDHHTHILPSVDDGVQSVERALKLLEWYEQLGVARVVMTPHIMENYPQNNASYLRDQFAKFNALYGGSIELSLGAEYMLDAQFRAHLDSDDMLVIGERTVLVEASYVAEPFDLMGQLTEVMSKGYYVVLAHPERYLYLSIPEYQRIKSAGVQFQLNIPSVLGCYGEGVKRRAEQLLKLGVYNLVGSDIHSLSSHSRLYNESTISTKVIKQIQEIISKTE